ncbi:MAG: response regulator [Verrucomicrobia bacterium]|nr:response regulator [Verrucomicrobiota bacterium]
MKRTILMIDDEPEYCEILRMRLEAHGFNVVTAPDGAKGLKEALLQPPDLILLDIMLPGLDGGDIAHRLRSEPPLSKIPVLFLTAAISAEEAERDWGRTEERMLSKTMDSEALLRRIQETLEPKVTAHHARNSPNKTADL